MPIHSTYNTFSILGYSSANTSTDNYILFDTLNVANTGSFGSSLDLSKNSNILVIGAPGSNLQRGNTYFFSNNSLKKFILVDTENSPNALLDFGNIVSTSYDANYTSITTGVLNASINERLYIYERNINSFALNSFFDGANQANSQYGSTQSINSNGDFIGITDTRSNIQTVYFYNRSGNTWSSHSNISFANANVTGPENIILNSDGSQCFISINTTNANANGEVQIYSRNNTTWTLDQTITASDSLIGDRFGNSLAINTSDNMLIIGAPKTSQSNIANVGGIYLFEYSISNSQWEQTHKLVPNTIAANLYIGYNIQSIDINNNNIIVGAQRYANLDGSVYVWQYNVANSSWDNTQQITSPTSNNYTFGSSISINDIGDIIIIGQPSANSFSGRVYQYVIN